MFVWNACITKASDWLVNLCKNDFIRQIIQVEMFMHNHLIDTSE